MRRLFFLHVLVSAGLLLGAAQLSAQEEEEGEGVEGQEEEAAPPQGLTMQMGNGWNFTFAGNVNAFLTYTDGQVDDDPDDAGAIVGGLVAEEQTTRIRTGLLPAFAVFEAKGREKGVDLGVHFGFAPQIQTGGVHDNFGAAGNGAGTPGAGAQIDMRQVYATVGGEWGQILFGREIGLYQRQNILTDMTLFGAGSSGVAQGNGGTTLGRIGVGYIYPNFNAQMTYSTAAGRPFQLSVGLFDPSFINGEGVSFTTTKSPRIESEITYTGDFGEANKVMLWANGLYQKADLSPEDEEDDDIETDANALGIGGGLKLDLSGFSLVGSGYYGEGLGTTLLLTTGAGLDAAGEERTSYGYIGQATYTAPGSAVTFGASYGDSRVNQTDLDESSDNDDLIESNRSFVGTLVWQATQSLKGVLEFARTESESHANTTNTENQGAAGLMLFF